MSREKIEKAYSGIVAELAERATLIRKEKNCSVGESVWQAIDDGFYYTDDRAVVLAWALESGLIEWGRDFEWGVLTENLAQDIAVEMGEKWRKI